MSRFPENAKRRCVLLGALLAATLLSGAAMAGDRYGFGRPVTPEEIAGWNRTVRAEDGLGLPAGSGNATDGEEVFSEKCAVCHGDFGEGTRYLPLAGGFDTLATADPVRTVGSFWPYAPGVFSYIYTSMPFGQAHSLTADETYGIVAYILYLNDLLGQDETLDAARLVSIRMPNRDGFLEEDPRPDVPAGEPCMKDCRKGEPVRITARAVDANITPDIAPAGK
ncbi:c-type cytochrome [Skermanella sp. TT6]|uniref:C-type cytochrome n=1 Tax=Skermanella cutis TaxID=2775420 RepID=A0ABX7B3P2_9PROT|nr:cytochrome c [Skermanella sp. TT6]QQP88959.1 c-type cytochrome [Skermanella sp. TT6]